MAIEVDGERTLFRPTGTTLEVAGGIYGMQVVFEDVTVETRRHDRMEAYATMVMMGQEEERRHLAQELHDGPVQTLVHLCRQIDSVESPTDAPHEQPLALSDLRITVEGTVAELRGIAKGLRPSILDDLGLVTSIRQMRSGRREAQPLRDVHRRDRRRSDGSPLPSSWRSSGSARRRSPMLSTTLGPTGSMSGSSSAPRASASWSGTTGWGCPRWWPPTGWPRGRWDFPGMAERTRLIGGTFAIHSGEQAGTTVDVWVPSATSGLG